MRFRSLLDLLFDRFALRFHRIRIRNTIQHLRRVELRVLPRFQLLDRLLPITSPRFSHGKSVQPHQRFRFVDRRQNRDFPAGQVDLLGRNRGERAKNGLDLAAQLHDPREFRRLYGENVETWKPRAMVTRRSSAASFTTEPGWLRPSSRRSEVRSAPSASLPSIPAGIPTATRTAPRGRTAWKPWKPWKPWKIWRAGNCRVGDWALPTR